MAGMLLLAKARKDGLGKFFTWISYLVIVIALLMLICQGARGVRRMMCRTGMCPPSAQCMPGMTDRSYGNGNCMMMHHGYMGGHGESMVRQCCMDHSSKCMEEMKECKMAGDSASCKMGMKHGGCPMEEEKADSAKKKYNKTISPATAGPIKFVYSKHLAESIWRGALISGRSSEPENASFHADHYLYNQPYSHQSGAQLFFEQLCHSILTVSWY